MRSDITDHLFIPQSHISNMCVCGEPNTAHVSVPTPVAPSFHMETSMMKDAVDILNDQLTAAQRLNIEIGRLRQRESMLEAWIEVLGHTIAKLRSVCDAAFTLVREDAGPDDCTDEGEAARTAWQELVSALEDTRYEPRSTAPTSTNPPEVAP